MLWGVQSLCPNKVNGPIAPVSINEQMVNGVFSKSQTLFVSFEQATFTTAVCISNDLMLYTDTRNKTGSSGLLNYRDNTA